MPGLAFFLYFPASHIVHAPPLLPIKPEGQTQAEIALLPAGEVLNVGQAEHVLSLSVYVFALQTQADIAMLPGGELFEGWHAVQLLRIAVPAAQVFAGHVAQTAVTYL